MLAHVLGAMLLIAQSSEPTAVPASQGVQGAAFVPLPAQDAEEVASDEHDPNERQVTEVRRSRPGSGRGLIIAGSIFTGIAVVNVATLPVCFLSNRGPFVSVCMGITGIVAGVAAAVGLPLLITGAVKAAAYKRFMRRYGMFDLAPAPGGVALGWHIAW